MRTSPQILASSNLNPKDKRVVVVEGVDPVQVQTLLPDVLIFVQGTEEDFGDTIFSSLDGVLNVLKPSLYVCDTPSESDVKLCGTFGCSVTSLEHLTEELRILGNICKSTVPEESIVNSIEDLILDDQPANKLSFDEINKEFLVEIPEDQDMYYYGHKSQR